MIPKLTALFSMTLLWACMATADNYVAENSHKLTAGTGVRVRTNPSTSATEAGKLAIGTDVTITQRTAAESKVDSTSAYWYQLSTPIKGWVFGNLLRDFDPASPDEVFLALTRDKLGAADKLYDAYENRSPLSFGDALEISEFAKRAATEAKTPAAQGELELAHWRAIQIALASGTYESREKPPYSTWVKELGENVLYSDPSAEYLIQPDLLWKLADKHKDDASGEAIAWQAANAYVGGECEGFIGCMSARSLMMEGEYLKRYPQGKHIEAALTEANEVLDYMMKEWDNQRDDPGETDLKVWADMLAALPDTDAAATARKYLKALQAKH